MQKTKLYESAIETLIESIKNKQITHLETVLNVMTEVLKQGQEA